MGYDEVSQKDGESKFVQKKTTRDKMRSLGLYLCNPKEKTFLERTLKSWGKIGLFYLVFYICLAGFWAAMIFGFFTTIEDDQPKLQDWDSLIKYNPGMGYRPQPDVEFTLIKFNQGEPDSYKKYTQHLNTFLEDYAEDKQVDNGLVECDPDDANFDQMDPALACRYPLTLLGEECTKDKHYGYDEGRPCVLLKMNKLFNWKPDAYGNNSAPSDAPVPKPGFIGVSCEGTTDTDVDNIGPIRFWPENGFDMTYFPYQNQKKYLAPVVMVQLQRIRPGTLVQVWCKVWADNIYHDSNDRAGSVKMEILMD